MNETDKAQFKEIMGGFLRHWNKTPNKQLLRSYWDALKWLTIERLESLVVRIYSEAPRYLPSPRGLAAMAKGSTADATAGSVPAGVLRRRLEIAALRARLNGQPPPCNADGEIMPVRLLALQDRGGYTDVAELPEADARHWLDKFEREAEQEAAEAQYGQPDQPADPRRAKRLTTALGSLGGGS